MKKYVYVCILLSSLFGHAAGLDEKLMNSTVDGMVQRLLVMLGNARSTVLVHEHIPKAGGTALSLALASGCKCEKHEISLPGVCHDCRQAFGDDGHTYPYTVSRVTGWPCGGHAPLTKMRKLPCRPDHLSLRQIGFHPVFIVMLREPFARFVSETGWLSKWGQAADWSVRVKKRNGEWKYLPGVSANQSDDLVVDHVNFPAELIMHNRHVKMIGGKKHNFDMTFEPSEQLGSRWHQAGDTMEEVFSQASDIIANDKEILLGIHERFQETLCLLEVLYGHMQPFHWNPNVHSHHGGKDYNITIVKQFTKSLAEYKTDGVYDIWLEKNKWDVMLYEQALVNFDIQFRAAMHILVSRLVLDKSSNTYAPHCNAYVDATVASMKLSP